MGSTEVRQQWTEYHRTQDIGHMREHHRAQVTGHSITGHRAGRIGRSVLIEGMLEVLVGGDDGGDGDVGGALEGTANAFKTGVKWGPRALEWGPRVGPQGLAMPLCLEGKQARGACLRRVLPLPLFVTPASGYPGMGWGRSTFPTRMGPTNTATPPAVRVRWYGMAWHSMAWHSIARLRPPPWRTASALQPGCAAGPAGGA